MLPPMVLISKCHEPFDFLRMARGYLKKDDDSYILRFCQSLQTFFKVLPAGSCDAAGKGS